MLSSVIKNSIGFAAEHGTAALLYRISNRLYDILFPDRYKAVLSIKKNEDKPECIPKISVIILNAGEAAKASVKCQSISPCEVLCVSNIAEVRGMSGEYALVMRGTDVLDEDCLLQMSLRLEREQADLVYADSDLIIDGKRQQPFFKPDYSPDLLRCFDYMGVCLFKGARLKEYLKYEDYLIRYCEGAKISHISRVLSSQAERVYSYKFPLYKHNNPRVSIIIPSKDNFGMLKRCVDTVLACGYDNIELIVTDNGSNTENKALYEKYIGERGGKYIYKRSDFNFAYMCNLGAESASGELLLFLNDDIEAINGTWFNIMVGQALCPHTGAVGAKLLYSDKSTIQHCGVMSIQNGPVHYFAGRNDDRDYYFGRNRAIYNVSAVTAACLMLKRSIFDGFDETLEVNYNDVALCYGLLGKGYYNVVRNDAVLIHHESVSRGKDSERLYRELGRLKRLYPNCYGYDRFYNENLNQHTDDMSIERPYRLKESAPLGIKRLEKCFEANFDAEVDYIAYTSDTVKIGGFIDVGVSGKKSVLLLSDREYALNYEVLTELRYDKKNTLGGFSCSIDIRPLQRGEYILALAATNIITNRLSYYITDRKITIR